MKKFFRFIVSKLFLYNFLLVLLIVAVLFTGVWVFLRVYTDHGEVLTVPALVGLHEAEVKDICSQKGLRYEIMDSVYSDDVELGAIAEQNPRAGSKVKFRRRIYLIKNAEQPETVPLPDIYDISFRQARSILEAYGLQPGRLEYIPDIGKNVVLRMKINGEIVKAGIEVLKGDTVDLVLGQGLSDDKTYVPNVEGLTIDAATTVLNDRFLNVGAVLYDESVSSKKDTLSSKIFKQYPPFDTINHVNLGTFVDVWLSTDTMKIPEYVPDSVLLDSISPDSLKNDSRMNMLEYDEENNQ
ncbi:MAG: PASTA domain-containing protein [Bacteroidota bacterium]|nr:PASTA domain-containing protein [Bacteroidota bacterium]